MIDYGIIVPPKYHLYFEEDFLYDVGAGTIGRKNVFIIYAPKKQLSPYYPKVEPILILGTQEELKNNKLFPLLEYKDHKIDFLASLYELEPSLLDQNEKLNSYLCKRAQRLIDLQILK